MVVPRLNLVILAAAVSGVLWIEHAHRIRIETSAPAAVGSNTAACPENESVPFSADCMRYIQGGVVGSDDPLRANAVDGATSVSPEQP
jgi:hypothetical protein